MARSKRSPVERAAFLALSAALIVGAWICIHRAAYPVTEPYQFPVTTDSPEWAELAEAGLARNACRLPAGLAEQMTSEALLETALEDIAALTGDAQAFSDPVQGFWSNAKYNDALAELVTRPNAAAVVERAFSKLPPLTEITDVEVMIRWTYLSAFSQGLANPQEA